MTVSPVQVGIGMGAVSDPRQLGWLLVYADAEAQVAQVRRGTSALLPFLHYCHHPDAWYLRLFVICRSVCRSFRRPVKLGTRRRFDPRTRTVSDLKAPRGLSRGRSISSPRTSTRCVAMGGFRLDLSCSYVHAASNVRHETTHSDCGRGQQDGAAWIEILDAFTKQPRATGDSDSTSAAGYASPRAVVGDASAPGGRLRSATVG
eukprot:COSAG02_NODE_4835_length_4923_cov_20.132670_3_plen_204_part_00